MGWYVRCDLWGEESTGREPSGVARGTSGMEAGKEVEKKSTCKEGKMKMRFKRLNFCNICLKEQSEMCRYGLMGINC